MTLYGRFWVTPEDFTKQKTGFKMHQDAVRQPSKSPPGTYAKDYPCGYQITSPTGGGFTKNAAEYAVNGMVYPTNVLHFAVESKNRHHPAPFPEGIPEFFAIGSSWNRVGEKCRF